MSVKKDRDERFRQRTITLPPEIDEFLDTFPKGSMSFFVAKAIRRSTEYRKYSKGK
jgi:hypothetical protein